MVALTINLKLPTEVEERLRNEHPDLDADAAEAYAIDLFRRGLITHYELGVALGIDRFAADALLKRRGVFEHSVTYEEIEADVRTLEQALKKRKG